MDIYGDPSNCGACGTACTGGATCQGGYCVPPGTFVCSGWSVQGPSVSFCKIGEEFCQIFYRSGSFLGTPAWCQGFPAGCSSCPCATVLACGFPYASGNCAHDGIGDFQECCSGIPCSCDTDAQCQTGVPGDHSLQVCDLMNHTCVDCNTTADCASPKTCVSHVCN
jgi:hypothetical protein